MAVRDEAVGRFDEEHASRRGTFWNIIACRYVRPHFKVL